jgi:RNA polymerase sigma factor (sigma-70 family)
MSNVLDQNLLEASSATAPAEDCVGSSVEPASELDAGPALESLPVSEPAIASVGAMPPPIAPDAPLPPDAVPAGPAEDVETLYLTHRTLLFYVACRKFHIPEGDAESLIQEVFLSYLQSATRIDNPRAWLVAAMCNASRHYWRAQGRTDQLPEDFGRESDPASLGLAEQFALQMTVRQCLRYLQPRCRETLALHYFEGRSATEVAREMGTTVRYAEKLIHNCLKRVREIYVNITTVTKR